MRWVKYHNGNYDVFINLENGTKVRKNDLDNLTPEYPESMDIKITNRCKHGCAMCFPEGTLVQTSTGLVPIERINIGNAVRTLNINSNQVEEQKVVTKYQHEVSNGLIELTFEDDTKIRCTPNHKFWTTRGWVPACELTDTDDIIRI